MVDGSVMQVYGWRNSLSQEQQQKWDELVAGHNNPETRPEH